MANFYYNQNDSSWYSDADYTISADISTITSGDAIYGFLGEGALSGVNLSGVNLSGVGAIVDFGSTFVGFDFRNVASMPSALIGNLENAIFPNDISGIWFGWSNFTGVDFSDVTNMAGAMFDNATFTNAILPSDISGIWFGPSNFTGVDFSNVTNMAGANFTGANLTGVDFSNVTNWNGANFEGADLTGAILPLEMTGSQGDRKSVV